MLSLLIDAVAGSGELSEIYQHALEGLDGALGVKRSAVLLLDEHRIARFVAARGISLEYRSAAEGHFPWPTGTIDPPPLAVTDVFGDPSLEQLYDVFRRENIRSLAFIPLVYRGRLLGKFMLYHAEPHEFTDEELMLASTIGRLIAFAVERTKIEHALRDVDRRKDEFLATLAHELRNPLATLSASLDLAAMRFGEGIERECEVAQRQVSHLSRLVGDLLDLSRISRGLVELRKEPLEVSTAVARAVESVRPLLDRMHHQLLVNVPARRFFADPVRLEQILSNLLGNAAKYTPPGGTISVSATNEPEQIVLRVSDNGIGMPADLVARVFDLFTQGERTLARSQGGLGIGLTITKQLVTQHGGTITASSAGPGKGSEFVVTLPAPRLNDAELTIAAASAAKTPANLRGTRLLLVEDNLELASMLADLIRSWGYIVDVETNAIDALALVAGIVPDVILIDIGLPDLDGYELARRLRAMPRMAATTLIAMSGYGQRDDIRRSLEVGFVAHLVKPVDTRALRDQLDQLARKQPIATGMLPAPPST